MTLKNYARSTSIVNKIGLNICLVLAIALFAIIGFNSFYARPIYDDIWLSNLSREYSPGEAVLPAYFLVTGRYAFIWLTLAFMRVCSVGVGWFVLGAILIWGACWLWAFAKRGSVLPALGSVAAIVISCATLTPQPLNSLYWFAAAANILPALAMLPLLVVARRVRGPVGAILGFALGLVLAGFQEQSAMVVGCAILFLLARDWRRQSRSVPTIGVMCGFVCGAIILLASPANAVRAWGESVLYQQLPRTQAARMGLDGAQELMSSAVPHFGLQFSTWLDIPHLSFSWDGAPVFWAFALTAMWGNQLRPSARVEWKKMAVIAFCGWALCSLMMTVSGMAIRQPPALYPRIYFVPAFVVALTFAAMGYYARGAMRNPQRWFVALVFLSLAGSGNAVRELARTSIAIRRFAQKWDAQDAQLKSLKKQGIRNVRLEPIMGPQGPIWTADRIHVINLAVASYYGFNSIAAPTETLTTNPPQ